MISALHLFWILPLAITAGGLTVGFMASATQYNREHEAYIKGIKKGQEMSKSISGKYLLPTFEDMLRVDFKHDLNAFITSSGALMYGIDLNGQMYMIDISNPEDLKPYYSYNLVEISEEGSFKRPIISEGN